MSWQCRSLRMEMKALEKNTAHLVVGGVALRLIVPAADALAAATAATVAAVTMLPLGLPLIPVRPLNRL